MSQSIFQRLRGLFAEKAAAEKADLRQVVELLATGREAELPSDDEVFAILEAAGIDASDLAEIVDRERQRSANIKAVAAGRDAAILQRKIFEKAEARRLQFEADTVALRQAYGRDYDQIQAELAPVNTLLVNSDRAQRELVDSAQDAKYAGLSRDQRIEAVNSEIATGATINDRVKELDKAERHARAAVDMWKSRIRDRENEETIEGLRVAKIVHERASKELSAARSQWDEFDKRRRAEEAEVLELVAAG